LVIICAVLFVERKALRNCMFIIEVHGHCDVWFVERKTLRNCMFTIEVNCCYFCDSLFVLSLVGMCPDVFPTGAHITGLGGPKD
jgi:hypothetical protein